MAKRWTGKAQFYVLYSREAHPKAKGLGPLSQAGEMLMKKDQNGDNQVTFEEFGGPSEWFAPFDINNDGIVNSHELLAATKISQFADVSIPETYEERLALARRYREECPGVIPVLVDGLDNATSKAYGRRPNSAFIVDADGKLTHKLEWANERDVERALVDLVGGEAPPMPEIKETDWSPVREAMQRATAANKRLLVEFTSPGCGACKAMEAEILSKHEIKEAMAAYEVTKLGVELDPAWALFESLELTATPAFVIIEPGPKAGAHIQGFAEADAFAAFLGGS